MTTFTYPGVTPAKFQAMITELQGKGGTIKPLAENNWDLSLFGVSAAAAYTSAAQTLSVVIISKHGLAWFFKDSQIDEVIKQALSSGG